MNDKKKNHSSETKIISMNYICASNLKHFSKNKLDLEIYEIKILTRELKETIIHCPVN